MIIQALHHREEETVLEKEKETVNFSLPRSMREFVEAQIRSGRYGNISEYMRELIRRDQDRATQDRMEALLLQSLDGLRAGQSIEITPEYWEQKRQELLQRHAVRMKAAENATPGK